MSQTLKTKIPLPEPERVFAPETCPKCGKPTKFCSHCTSRFCDNPACPDCDTYHRAECRDQHDLGD
ncbi:MAG: hypothetical protein NTX59_08420 [Elusimicrobia bacterium]|nr:hypothetical protein [Elusimicrobiota bacterium]